MFRLALRAALAKKRRLIGTALSVTLGIAFLAGTLVFTDTIKRTFDDLFTGIYAETDTVVRADTSIELEFGGSQRGRIPTSLIATVAAIDGVAEANGYVTGFAQIVTPEGDALGNPGQGAPTMGMSFGSEALTPWRLVEGSRVPGPGEVVVDRGSARTGDLQIGDEVTVLTQTGPHRFPVVGIARFGTADSPAGATVAIFDLTTAQQVLIGSTDEVDAVWVDAAPGVTEEDLTDRIAAAIPDGTEALTGTAITEEMQNDLKSAFSFFNTFLLVFAAIALVVASFTIYNTFQIIVSQRSKEMALLRAVGATRRQVLHAQLLEAVILGIIASVVGLFAGVVVARGLKALLGVIGFDIPAGGTVFQLRTAIVSLTVGVLVTIASAVFPSIRASRVLPLAAIRDITADTGAKPDRRRLLNGSVVVVLGAIAFVAGLSGAALVWVGIGALLVFIGASVLSPLMARPLTRFVGGPIVKLSGTTGLLARENAARNPKRTARSGGALMIGVALVAAITIIAATAKDWTRDVFEGQFRGDFVVATSTFGYGGLPPEVAGRVDALPEVEAAAGVRVGVAIEVSNGGADTNYVSVDPRAAAVVFDLGMVAGSFDGLTVEGILVEDGAADSRGLAMGDEVVFGFLDGSSRSLTVQGIYTKDDLAGSFVVSNALHEQTGIDQFDFSVFVLKADGVSDAAAERAIAAVTDDYPIAELQSRSAYIDSQAAQIDQILNLMYGLLALAIVIALFSIANSISLSIYERTRELGLLRAVGMTRHQVGSVVRWEAVVVAVIGTLFGIALGLLFGWALSVTLRGDGLTVFNLPVVALVVIVVVSVIGGVLASLRPAWRASHLDVLPAIASE